MSEKDVLQETPDMSQVDFDTRLKVLLGVPPREEITVYEESEEKKNNYQNDKNS